MSCHYYVLTRFNIRLWTKDKKGKPTQTEEWLKKRFELFEQYCLPSVANQSVKNFKWIVLFDSETPEVYKKKIDEYARRCEQFTPHYVAPAEGRYFIRIFQKIILENINLGDVIITTYLDNDDALRYDYVEKVERLAGQVRNRTFISFKYGIQYFTELNIATRVAYRNNHFLSFIEKYEENVRLRTVMGYGSHINVGRYKGTEALFVETPESEKWVELVHDTNMDNDVRMTFDTHLITDLKKLKNDFGIHLELAKNSKFIFYTVFLKRTIKEIFRHIRLKIVGRKWN